MWKIVSELPREKKKEKGEDLLHDSSSEGLSFSTEGEAAQFFEV